MTNIKINDINSAGSESFISDLEDNELQVLGGCCCCCCCCGVVIIAEV